MRLSLRHRGDFPGVSGLYEGIGGLQQVHFAQHTAWAGAIRTDQLSERRVW